MIIKAHGKSFKNMHLQWHAVDAQAAFTNTNNVAFPDTEAVNATGAQATDGTEFVKVMIDNYMFGRQQALLNHVGITPDGNAEADGASQEIEALQRMGMMPGQMIISFWNDDPATLGIRALMLQGQGIVRANYPDLDDNVYVGDADNATASAFYHADNSDGSSRNTAGAYLILPDFRGQTIRGLDTSAVVDPDGASRDLGNIQLDAFQGHAILIRHSTFIGGSNGDYLGGNNNSDNGNVTPDGTIKTDGTNGTPRTDVETRMTNGAADIGIIY
jgi:hypothetical protein